MRSRNLPLTGISDLHLWLAIRKLLLPSTQRTCLLSRPQRDKGGCIRRQGVPVRLAERGNPGGSGGGPCMDSSTKFSLLVLRSSKATRGKLSAENTGSKRRLNGKHRNSRDDEIVAR